MVHKVGNALEGTMVGKDCSRRKECDYKVHECVGSFWLRFERCNARSKLDGSAGLGGVGRYELGFRSVQRRSVERVDANLEASHTKMATRMMNGM